MKQDPFQKYKQTKIETASPGKLVVMLYEGAVKFLAQAKDALQKKKYDTVNDNLIRTQNIITELMLSLDMSRGEIARNLYLLYDYMNRRLIEANVKKDLKIMEEVEGMLRELLGAWEEAVKKCAPA
jgi:flagellar protein FliS